MKDQDDVLGEDAGLGGKLGDEDRDEFDDVDEGCYLCAGAGYIITCIDDLCHGSDHCMHGDGEENCPVCNKDGDKEWII